jgi:hypothetical protein
VANAADTEKEPQPKNQNMKTLTKLTLAVTMLLASMTLCNAQGYHHVRSYYRHDGAFVPSHYQTNPDGNIYNNWSTYPNINPFTGRQGTINPYCGLHTMPRSSGYDLDPESNLYVNP